MLVRSAVAAALFLAVSAPAIARVDASAPEPVPSAQPLTSAGPAADPTGEVIVRLERGAAAQTERRLVSVARARSVRRIHVRGVRVLRLDEGESPRDAVRRLSSAPGVAWAEPNRVARLHAVPNDPLLSEEWGLHNFGQVIGGFQAGVSDVDSDLLEAWDLTPGSADVLVAVIDTGLAFAHPDLGPQAATNPGESGGGRESNDVDDDGNGFVDDFRGWDFVDDDNDPSDPGLGLQHGSLVASIIGARGNDGSGVTGAAQQAAILPLRVAGINGTLTTADAAEAYAYAASRGARIVNASFGGFGISEVELAAINAAPKVLFIASAGNDAVDTDADPVSPCVLEAPNVLCVAASDQDDSLADFSNYGAQTVDISAPGVRMLGAQQPFATFFSDGFETNLSKWQAGAPWERTSAASRAGSFSITDSPAGNYANNADTAVRNATAIDLSGQSGCRLEYFMRFEAEGGPGDFVDGVIVEAANASGGPWNELNRYAGTTGSRFFSFTEDLAAFSGDSSVFVRFRFVSDATVVFDGAYIDQVAVQCRTSTATGRDFTYGNGTSFSAPLVSGIAVLALALEPALTPVELKQVLLAGIDPVAALAGRTVTGGRSNAAKVLASIPPRAFTEPAAAVSATAATLRGTARLHGQPGTFRFELGPGDGTYPVRSADVALGNPAGDKPIEARFDRLRSDVTFHYRVVVTTAGGTAVGNDQTVTTGSAVGARVGDFDVVHQGRGWRLALELTEPARFDGVLDDGKRLRAVTRGGLTAGRESVPLGRLRRGSHVLDFALTDADGNISGVARVEFSIARGRQGSAARAAVARHGSGDPDATLPETPAPLGDAPPGFPPADCPAGFLCLPYVIDLDVDVLNLRLRRESVEPIPVGAALYDVYENEHGKYTFFDHEGHRDVVWLEQYPESQTFDGVRVSAARDSVRIKSAKAAPTTPIAVRLADGTFALAVAAPRLGGAARRAANRTVKAEVAVMTAGYRYANAAPASQGGASRKLGLALASLARVRTAAGTAVRGSRQRMSASKVRRFQKRVATKGLLPQVSNQLKRAGANQATLALFRTAFAGSPRSALAGKTLPEVLSQRRTATALRAAARRMYLLGMIDIWG